MEEELGYRVRVWSQNAEIDRVLERRSGRSVPEEFVVVVFIVPGEILQQAQVRNPQYVEQIGSILRHGGWSESDVSEIMEMVLVDNQVVLDALLLKVDRFSDSLQKAGWRFEEVSDALGFDFRSRKEKKNPDRFSFINGRLFTICILYCSNVNPDGFFFIN
ncbi:hypothetical protein TorRG33x02_235570 [Trema orientale]|uniref:Uncharacterized protein n=1 Tax=Trema orientale TaxID=63057 RepID=A0A2P5E205_TREOI|nr:hypothetical protein TorRG33x02_235570 [Trema orientale]